MIRYYFAFHIRRNVNLFFIGLLNRQRFACFLAMEYYSSCFVGKNNGTNVLFIITVLLTVGLFVCIKALYQRAEYNVRIVLPSFRVNYLTSKYNWLHVLIHNLFITLTASGVNDPYSICSMRVTAVLYQNPSNDM